MSRWTGKTIADHQLGTTGSNGIASEPSEPEGRRDVEPPPVRCSQRLSPSSGVRLRTEGWAGVSKSGFLMADVPAQAPIWSNGACGVGTRMAASLARIGPRPVRVDTSMSTADNHGSGGWGVEWAKPHRREN
jgi:hypothetical protein